MGLLVEVLTASRRLRYTSLLIPLGSCCQTDSTLSLESILPGQVDILEQRYEYLPN
ncbi:hypothetical protein EDE15_4250 [Edaphobacter aggregans]|uniref:Uncharacterized protein n=1 Tax=Edaphobacter aggregans TaxID=570835 RepID=A0A428MP86_9BACT|nr:hypothetical protein EDE15_4250 [Edaphobacter aggregans]